MALSWRELLQTRISDNDQRGDPDGPFDRVAAPGFLGGLRFGE